MTAGLSAGRLEAKFLGAMVASALGDAIGELAFSYPQRQDLMARLEQSALLQYTDDTAMALGLAESICSEGRIDPGHLGDIFRRNFEQEPWRGYASGPPTVFHLVQSLGLSYTEAARRLYGGAGSFGNGAAMRVAPVGLFWHDSAELYEHACAAAKVTHAHPVGKDGAAVQASAVALAVKLDPTAEFPAGEFIEELAVFARTRRMREKMKLVQTLWQEGSSASAAAVRLGRSVAVDESMPFAVYAFLCHASSLPECLFCAILNGGDRDTLGAMAGALAGAYLGIEAVPEKWRSRLENRDKIEALALKLARRRAYCRRGDQ